MLMIGQGEGFDVEKFRALPFDGQVLLQVKDEVLETEFGIANADHRRILLEYIQENTPTARLRRPDAPPQLKQITQSNAVNELLMIDPEIFKKEDPPEEDKKARKGKSKRKPKAVDVEEIIDGLVQKVTEYCAEHGPPGASEGSEAAKRVLEQLPCYPDLDKNLKQGLIPQI